MEINELLKLLFRSRQTTNLTNQYFVVNCNTKLVNLKETLKIMSQNWQLKRSHFYLTFHVVEPNTNCIN